MEIVPYNSKIMNDKNMAELWVQGIEKDIGPLEEQTRLDTLKGAQEYYNNLKLSKKELYNLYLSLKNRAI